MSKMKIYVYFAIVLYFPFNINFGLGLEICNLDKPKHTTKLNIFNSGKEATSSGKEIASYGALNLNHYLDPLGHQKCFIMVDNFANTDIKHPNFPLIFRKYSVAAIPTKGGLPLAAWIDSNLDSQNDTNLQCRLSKYKSGISSVDQYNYDRSYDLCVTLNLVKFSSDSKPWNCQVHILLHLDAELISQRIWTVRKANRNVPIFSCCQNRPIYLYQRPSNRPSFTAYVIRDQKWIFKTERVIRNIISQSKFNNRNTADVVSHDVNAIFVTQKPSSSNAIYIVRAYLLCITCSYSRLIQKSKISSSQLSNLDHISNLPGAFPSVSESLQWDVQNLLTANTLQTLDTNVFRYLSNCGNNVPLNSPVEKLDFAYGKLWLSIIKNHTYDLGANVPWSCSNGKKVPAKWNFVQIMLRAQVRVTTEHLLAFPIHLNIKLNSLGFVSCGVPVKQALPFQELTNIFHPDVWAICFVTLMLCSILPLFIGTPSYPSVSSFVKKIEIQVRIILGQDTPVQNIKFNDYLILLLSVASIVLSNAYKYDNVYRMIAPKDEIPFEYFRQIRDAGFKTFTRIGLISINQVYISRNKYSINKSDHEIIRQAHLVKETERFGIIILSEITHLLSFNKQSPLDYDELYIHTDLSPDLGKVATDLASNMNVVSKTRLSYTEENLNNLYKKLLREKENELLFSHLKTCNKSALTLPTYLTNNFAKTLQEQFWKNLTNSFENKRIDTSNEVYYQTYYTFNLVGIIPPYIMQRIKGVQSSGLFEWHEKIVSNTIKYIPDRGRLVEVPNMSGNVLVIFVVFMVGLVIATVAYVLEILHKYVLKLVELMYLSVLIVVNLVSKYLCLYGSRYCHNTH